MEEKMGKLGIEEMLDKMELIYLEGFAKKIGEMKIKAKEKIRSIVEHKTFSKGAANLLFVFYYYGDNVLMAFPAPICEEAKKDDHRLGVVKIEDGRVIPSAVCSEKQAEELNLLLEKEKFKVSTKCYNWNFLKHGEGRVVFELD